MDIYTKTGDDGTTSLIGGVRVKKSEDRIASYGEIDELNAHLGLLRDLQVNRGRQDILKEIQDRLFTIGAHLALAPTKTSQKIPDLLDEDTRLLESAIDQIQAILPPLKSFILPGGHIEVSYAHIARTVCRRAERAVVKLSQTEPMDFQIIKYLNRLSDYLFVLARAMAKDLGAEETRWLPRR
jgi:cob(I)alamin adenosyltransferase